MQLDPDPYALTFVCEGIRRIFQSAANAELMGATLMRYREQGRFLLHGFVVMPEHVHVVVTPRDSVERAVQMIKGGYSFAVREQLAGVVWQDGYYDHRVRDEQDDRQQFAYIAGNPEKRGLVDYPYVPTRLSG